MTPKKTSDVIEKQLTSFFAILSGADLAERGLPPGGTLYPPTPLPLSPAQPPPQRRPLREAAVLASELRTKHKTLAAIGRHLQAAGFHPPRGGKWYPATVAKLIAQHAPDDHQPIMQSGSHSR